MRKFDPGVESPAPPRPSCFLFLGLNTAEPFDRYSSKQQALVAGVWQRKPSVRILAACQPSGFVAAAGGAVTPRAKITPWTPLREVDVHEERIFQQGASGNHSFHARYLAIG
jgi:hypothetical protein